MDSILAEADRLVSTDRNQDYGDPADDFARAAAIWSAILGVQVQPYQIGLCMIGVKLSRAVESPAKRDHWVDIAGYAKCGHHCIVADEPVADYLEGATRWEIAQDQPWP